MVQTSSSQPSMRLAKFIKQNIEPILVEWEAFARTIPPAGAMSVHDLRHHAKDVLLAIGRDMESAQSEVQREEKSKERAPVNAKESAATEHGAVRQLHGFDLSQVASEYRALRAVVLRLWKDQLPEVTVAGMEDIARFNESLDQALAESIAAHSLKMSEARETFMAILGHDLRAPLAAMNNCILLLHKPDTPASSRERVLHIAARSIVHMDGLITDLLQYTRTRLGRGIEAIPKTGDFGALFQEALEGLRVAHPDHHLVYESSGDLTGR